MSHFCAIALVPNETEDVKATIEEMLAPYSEHIQVDPYDEDCWCIGNTARQDARKRVINELGTVEDNERALHKVLIDAKCIELAGGEEEWDRLTSEYSSSDKRWEIQADAQASLSTKWRELISKREELEKKYEEEHEFYKKPNAECGDCNGSGTCSSTYNPVSKWDWWQIGGRWSASLKEDYEPRDDPANQEKCEICQGSGMRNDSLGLSLRETDPTYTCNGCQGKGVKVKWPTQWVDAGGNIEPASAVPESFTPYALVTPDGEWHEMGKMGWFGLSTDEEDPEVWAKFCKEEIGKLADTHLAVIVDCHI